MRTLDQILELLPQLDHVVADELEDQDLDFKCSVTLLKQRSRDREPGLSNADLRTITSFNRDQINRLMRELRQQHPEIQLIGEKKGSRYHYEKST